MAFTIPSKYPKRYSWNDPDGTQRGTFRRNPGPPKFAYKAGERLYAVTRENPTKWRSKGPTYAATLYVGFSVGDKPTWKMSDLVALVKQVRRRQVKHPDSTFLYQRGVYTHEKDGHVVTEDGGQVILLNVDPVTRKPHEFREHVIRLAEIIAEKFKQETVIVAIEKDGALHETIGVIANRPKKRKKAAKKKTVKKTARKKAK